MSHKIAPSDSVLTQCFSISFTAMFQGCLTREVSSHHVEIKRLRKIERDSLKYMHSGYPLIVTAFL